jgi:hypothetical protein
LLSPAKQRLLSQPVSLALRKSNVIESNQVTDGKEVPT